jgi:hypothetical protein
MPKRPASLAIPTLEGTMPMRREIASITSHSWRASPRGSTTASVIWMNGFENRARNGSGKSSRSYMVVDGNT